MEMKRPPALRVAGNSITLHSGKSFVVKVWFLCVEIVTNVPKLNGYAVYCFQESAQMSSRLWKNLSMGDKETTRVN